MKILVLTDSLGLPRNSPQIVPLAKTWTFQLTKEFAGADFEFVRIGGATSIDLLKQFNYFKVLNPGLLIVQAGIVDAAPRSLKKWESLFLSQYWLTNKFLTLIRRNSRFLRKIRHISYGDYKQLNQLINKVSDTIKIIWIGIPTIVDEYEKKVPGINKNVNKFNAFIKGHERIEYIDLSDFNAGDLMSDFHHLTISGNAKLSQRIKDKIESFF